MIAGDFIICPLSPSTPLSEPVRGEDPGFSLPFLVPPLPGLQEAQRPTPPSSVLTTDGTFVLCRLLLRQGFAGRVYGYSTRWTPLP